MNKSLAIVNDFGSLAQVGEAFVKSGLFSGMDKNKAMVKIMAGMEMGLPPFASMSGLHVIKGKIVIGANIIATMIKAHPNYNYRVLAMSSKECKIQFYENGEACGVSSFSWQDAQTAGLTNKDNWKKHPQNMLFARAISNGAKWFCPDIASGSPVYTPDEITIESEPTPHPTRAPLGVEPIEDGELVIEDEETTPEQRILNGRGVDFLPLMVELLPYNHENHVKNTLKKMGVTGISGKPAERVEIYKKLKEYKEPVEMIDKTSIATIKEMVRQKIGIENANNYMNEICLDFNVQSLARLTNDQAIEVIEELDAMEDFNEAPAVVIGSGESPFGDEPRNQ